MNTFRHGGKTYAAVFRPSSLSFPNRHESVMLRKTGEKVNVHEYIRGPQKQRVVWADENDDWYVRWDKKFYRIDKHFGTDVWHLLYTHVPLVGEA